MGMVLCSTLSIEGIPYENEALNGVTHEFRGWMVGDGGSGIVALSKAGGRRAELEPEQDGRGV